jgi:hypothetical protein
MVSAADAHHKAGHNPPGHHKHYKGKATQRIVVPAPQISGWAWSDEVTITIEGSQDVDDPALVVAYSEDLDWRLYRDSVYDFSIELPFAVFEAALEGGRGLRLEQVGGGSAYLDVYGAQNVRGLSPQDFVSMLEQNDLVGEVTYRAGGKNWFVLSGYYTAERPDDEQMIFYTKFMFSQDGTRISAFEVSYPRGEKELFDAIVVRLEDTLSAPT